MLDRPVALDDPDHPHVVERDHPANGSRDAVEDVLQLERLRGDLGDLDQDRGKRF